MSDDHSEIDQLDQEQERVARELYKTNPNDNRERHQQLQDEYNRIGRERHELSGATTSYIEKRDVRHELDPGVKGTKTLSNGSTRRTIRMPLYDPDTVINWRRHKIGLADDNKFRKKCTKKHGASKDGDEAGHHIGLRFGADPKEELNIARQVKWLNQKNYAAAERKAAKIARDNPDRKLFIEVVEVRNPDKYGENRPVGSIFRIVDEDGRRFQYEPFGNFPVRGTEEAKQAQAQSANWKGNKSIRALPSGSTGEVVPIERGRELREQRSGREKKPDSLAGAFGGKPSLGADRPTSQIDDGLLARRQEVTEQKEKPKLTLDKKERSASTPHKPRL